jgi:hypothetical protein
VTDWAEYLDALEAAVHAMDTDLIEGRPPSAEALERLTMPSSDMPARLSDRRTLVLALLQDVTGRATARRDSVAGELLNMPRRRVQSFDRSTTLGSKLDITG